MESTHSLAKDTKRSKARPSPSVPYARVNVYLCSGRAFHPLSRVYSNIYTPTLCISAAARIVADDILTYTHQDRVHTLCGSMQSGNARSKSRQLRPNGACVSSWCVRSVCACVDAWGWWVDKTRGS